MPLEYSFHKHRLPKGLSYPLKRSQLDEALQRASAFEVHSVSFWWDKNASHDRITDAYFSNDRRFPPTAPSLHAECGRSWIRILAVPSPQRHETERIIEERVLPRLVAWLKQLENAGSAWRWTDHEFAAHYRAGQLRIEET